MSDPPFSDPPLLALLRQLPAGVLYALGSKAQLFAALELCRANAVRPPQWIRRSGVLAAEVVGGRVCEVTLAVENDRLVAACECSEAATNMCRHRLAVLFTLKKALAPAAVSGWQAEEGALAAIRGALLAPGTVRPETGPAGMPAPAAKAADEFAVVLEERYGSLFIEVCRNGLPAGHLAEGIPAALRPLLTGTYGYGIRPASVLKGLLDQGSLPCPLLLRQGEHLVPLTVEPPVTRSGRLRLAAGEEGVLASRVLDDGTSLGDRLYHFGPWIVDVERRRLVKVESPEIWSTWEGVREGATAEEEGYRIAWDDFGGLELMVASGGAEPLLEELHLIADAGERQAACAPLTVYQVEIAVDLAADCVHLTAGARIGERLITLDRQALALFTEAFIGRCSAPLRTLKRRRVLYETFFAARSAGTKTERTRIVRAALQGPDFRRRAVTREARDLLAHFFELDRAAAWHLTYAGGEWRLLRRDREREVRILDSLHRHFGETVFRESLLPGQAQVPRPAFFARLPLLLAEFTAAGIELRFAGQPLAPATLEIAVESTGAGIDWFELRPEIRCDGELLTEAAWRQALAQGIFEAGGRLRLLDPASRPALDLLAHLSGPAAKKARQVVRIPRLHILDCLLLRRLGAAVRLAPEDERILHDLEHFENLPARRLPQLHATLRDYQRLGYHWLAFLYEHKFGACLADDMGLGKTIQAISLLVALKEGQVVARAPADAPHLVVVPPSLLFNWESEIARFAPTLATRVYRGQGRSTDFAGAEVILTSYDLVRRDIEELVKIPFHVVIFDEAQAVKNIHAAVTGAVRRLPGAFKVALTGTPVENRLLEYWAIIDLILPGLLGDHRRFSAPRADASPEIVHWLLARTRPFVLRRTKEKIAAELPDKVEIDLHLELSDAQKTLYRETVAQVRKEVQSAWREQMAGQAQITVLAALMRLRRVCLDPRLAGGTTTGAAPKIAALCEHLVELRDEGHSVLVFSQFTSFLDLIEPELTAQAIPWLRLDGSTPVGSRKQLVERFQGSAEPLVFLLSLKAGGRGLNLTRATYVIHLDPWWNPAVENQAADRAHRIGQTRKVTVLRLLMRHTVEEKMMLLKERKQRLYRALLEDGRGSDGVALTREDFEFLVGSEA